MESSRFRCRRFEIYGGGPDSQCWHVIADHLNPFGGSGLRNIGPFMNQWYPVFDNNILNMCEANALSKLRKGSAELGAALVEAKQTVSMIAQYATPLARSLIAAKNGQWGRIPGILNMRLGDIRKQAGSLSVANKYLEYIFGWKPLMDDIYSSFQVLRRMKSPAMLITGKGVHTDTWSEHVPTTPDWGPQTRTAKRTTRVSLTGIYRSSVWETAVSLGVTNPAAVAWEVIPFSFIVDWMLPVGDFLESLMDPRGMEFLGGYKSVKVDGQCNTVQSPAKYPGWTWDSLGGTTAYRSGYFRETYGSFPMVAPYIKSPFSNSHAITASALIRQLL